MPDHQELPPLPEPEVVSYVTDSVMRKSELRTFSRSQVEDIQRQAFEAGKRSAVPAVSGETVEMPEFWSVDVADHSGRILLITEAAVSGRELNDEEMRAVIGAAKHLLAFVGYGLPPCNFDPDTHPTGEVEKDAAWQPIETAPKDGTAILLGARCGTWIGKWLPVFTSGYRPDNPWSSLMLNHDYMAEKWQTPTHWMPLPRIAMNTEAKNG